MTNSQCSKTAFLFLVFSVLLALASHSLAIRSNPKDQNDKKKPDCLIVDPDGSALIPGLGRILVPIPGTASYNPPIGDSSPLPEGDGTSSPPADDGEGTLSPPADDGEGTFSPPADDYTPLPGGDDSPTESAKQSIP